MNFEYFIASRLRKRDSKGPTLSGPLYKISVLAISLSVGVMIISVAVLQGFQSEIINKVIGFGAHIQVSSYDNNSSFEPNPIDANATYINSIKKLSSVNHVQVYATKAGIIKSKDEMEGTVLKGVSNDFDWTFFKQKIVSGHVFKINPTQKTDSILISQKIADKLKYKVGDKLLMYFIQDPPRVRKFTIAGIYNTGLEDLDAKYLIGDIKHIQKLNNWESNQIAGFEITLKDFNSLDETTNDINGLLEINVLAKSIKEQFPQLFDWLKLQDINVQVILILMLMVAMVNMISALIILILENTKVIGILKALGSSNQQLRKIFLYQSTSLIGKGLIWGNVVALILCLLQSHFHFIKLNEASYYIAYVPVKIDLIYVLIINLGTIIFCTLALLIPSTLVAKISPSKAIRFS